MTSEARHTREAPARSHLVALAESWALWRRVGLRGAGFPATEALRLGAAEAAEAADRLLTAESALEEARRQALAAVDAALDRLRASGGWDDAERRRPLLKALRSLKKGKVPEAGSGGSPAAETARLQAAAEALESARGAYVEVFERALAEQSREIFAIARGERFREAVLWQNRAAYHTGLREITTKPPDEHPRDSQRRQHEELIASYLQRYAVKNDTIGFFGPVAWAGLSPEPPPLTVRPGDRLIADRGVFFESWAIERLARPFERQALMKPWLVPRLLSVARVSGDRLHVAGQRPTPLPPAHAAALAACDGRRPAREVAAALVADPAVALGSEQEVYALLDRYREMGVLVWSFDVPVGPHSFDTFRRQLETVGHPKLRKVGHHAVETLDRARRKVAATDGDPEALDRALGELEETFERLTGATSTRRAGEAYGGRTLLYLDCVRDAEVVFGPPVLEALSGPLTLLLDGARWLTWRLAEASRGFFRQVYEDLARRTGDRRVDATLYSQETEPYLGGGASSEIESVGRALTDAWLQIFGDQRGEEPVRLESAALAEKAARLFACPGPGWQKARHHNPDVMIAAASPEAIARGDFELVLGEVHAAVNTLNSWTFMALCPYREEVFAAIDRDLPEPRIVPLAARTLARVTTRTALAHVADKDFLIPHPEEAPVRPPGRLLRLAELVVEDVDGELRIRSRDGELDFTVLECFGEMLSRRAAGDFGLLPPAPHRPRITVDKMVVHRESWSVPVAEIAFAGLKEPAERFLAARRWAAELGMPRFVFFKSPVEPKPIYVDFESPVYVDLLAKVLRRTESQESAQTPVAVSEMLPAPDQLWLPDAEGHRYCAEMRIVAVDQR